MCIRDRVTSPLSLVVTAFAPVRNSRNTLTPELRTDLGSTELWLVDLGQGKNRLGASALAYVYDELGHTAPNLDDGGMLRKFFEAIQKLNENGLLLAYHDRSDGGLWATLCEMAFAGRTGLDIDVSALGTDTIRALFAEELGAVVQIKAQDRAEFMALIEAQGLAACTHLVGAPSGDGRIRVHGNGQVVLDQELLSLYADWIETSHHIQAVSYTHLTLPTKA